MKRGSEVVLQVIPLQPVEKTVAMQVVTLQPMKDPGGEDNQPAAYGGLHAGGGGCALRENLQPVKSPH